MEVLYRVHIQKLHLYLVKHLAFNCLVPQLPALNLTCDTVGVIQPAVTMATSLQLRDAMKVLTEQPIDTKNNLWRYLGR